MGFETHRLGTAREMVKATPSMRLARAGCHAVSFDSQTCFPSQHT